jgi:hypothetical protein
MPLRRALPFALALLLAGVADAQAQTGPAAEASPCIQKFIPLRQDYDKRLATTQNAIKRKAEFPELCRLFTEVAAAETKMIKYVEEQGMWCGFPPEALPSMKAGHAKSLEYRKQTCSGAAGGGPARPAAPRLSDVLSPPIPDANTTKPGRGTFDTLTGSPLAR